MRSRLQPVPRFTYVRSLFPARIRFIFFFLVPLLLVIPLAACGSDEKEATTEPVITLPANATQSAESVSLDVKGSTTQTPTPTAPPTQGPTVRESDIINSMLESFTVYVGTTVIWTNRDNLPHTSTSGVPANVDGIWNSSVLPKHDQFSFTFTQPGVFRYWCRVHPNMTGTITVQSPTATSTSTPTSTLLTTGVEIIEIARVGRVLVDYGQRFLRRSILWDITITARAVPWRPDLP